MATHVDLDKITDQDKLKALAYDQMAMLEVTQANLRAINARLAQLGEEKEPAAKPAARRRAKS